MVSEVVAREECPERQALQRHSPVHSDFRRMCGEGLFQVTRLERRVERFVSREGTLLPQRLGGGLARKMQETHVSDRGLHGGDQ